jgi:MFS family permease
LSKRVGRWADRFGPRLFMGLGPLTAALGLALMTRLGANLNYVTDLLPALLLFSLGLTATVAPLTATVLADADESNAGIASGVNNAIARMASLLAIAAVGAVVAAQFSSSLDKRLQGVRISPAAQTALAGARRETLARVNPAQTGEPVAHAVESASVHAFRVGLVISAVLVALGGVLGLVGIRNPRREVRCEDCAGGQFAGQPLETGRKRLPVYAVPADRAEAAGARGP